MYVVPLSRYYKIDYNQIKNALFFAFVFKKDVKFDGQPRPHFFLYFQKAIMYSTCLFSREAWFKSSFINMAFYFAFICKKAVNKM